MHRLRSFTALRAILAASLLVQGFSPAAALATGSESHSSSFSVTTYGMKIAGNATYQIVGGSPTGAGTFTTGDHDDLTKYPEMACVPVLFAIKNTSSAKMDINVSPWIEWVGGGHQGFTDLEIITTTLGGNTLTSADNLNDFAYPKTSIKTATSFPTKEGGTVAATVTGMYSGKSNGTASPVANEGFRHYNVKLKSVPKGSTVNMLLCARLAVDANRFVGGNITTGVAKKGTNDVDHVDVITSSVLSLPTLTLEKDLIGTTATSSQFAFTVTPAINGQSVFNVQPGKVNVVIPNVPPVASYTITETGPSGYIPGPGAGTNCTFTGNVATATPAPGIIPVNAVCTFTNSVEPVNAKLTVVKVVINDNGGTKTVSQFPLFVNGTPVTSGQTKTLEPGEYQVTETSDPSYQATYSGACDANGNVLLVLADDKTCTITNDDRPTRLTVRKVVVNDQNGTKLVSDFPLFVNGVPVLSDEERVVTPGTYTVTETNFPNYVGTFSGDCDANGVVTMNAGDVKECIITNDDFVPATLTVNKVVVNDSGGIRPVNEFPLYIDGNPIVTGQTVTLPVGSHTVSEAFDSGYIGVFTGDCDMNGQVTLASGDAKTCTLTNNDVPVGLTIVTRVVNDNGGTLTPADFLTILQANADDPPSILNGDPAGVSINLAVGPYGVGQVIQNGYELSFFGDCFGFIDAGQALVCYITNNDIPATLTVIKNVVNNGTGLLVPSNFTMQVTGGHVSLPSFEGSQDGTTVTLYPGAYSVDESALIRNTTTPHGYTKSLESTCSGTISLGQNIVCTVTNDDPS